jgi:ClpP class serine protease
VSVLLTPLAIIPVYGFLTKRTGPFADFLGTTSYDDISENLRDALDNPLVEKIILDIDSPGGEVNGVFDLFDEIYAARQQKAIEAIANDDAFSAAYAIASSASKL